jgi:hypothetical protein
VQGSNGHEQSRQANQPPAQFLEVGMERTHTHVSVE